MTLLDAIGYAVLFFLSGLSFWLIKGGRDNFGIILAIASLVAGGYFLGWQGVATFVLAFFSLSGRT